MSAGHFKYPAEPKILPDLAMAEDLRPWLENSQDLAKMLVRRVWEDFARGGEVEVSKTQRQWRGPHVHLPAAATISTLCCCGKNTRCGTIHRVNGSTSPSTYGQSRLRNGRSRVNVAGRVACQCSVCLKRPRSFPMRQEQDELSEGHPCKTVDFGQMICRQHHGTAPTARGEHVYTMPARRSLAMTASIRGVAASIQKEASLHAPRQGRARRR